MRRPGNTSPLLRLSCSLFFFWLFSLWLEKLYNFFPLFFSVASRGGKTWRGPRQTVNGLDFQWSSQSADRCLTWERDWRSCQLGPGANLLFWGNLHRWRWVTCHCMQTLGSFFPLLYPCLAHVSFHLLPDHSLVLTLLKWALYVPLLGFISSCILWTTISPLGQENTQETAGMAEATWLDYKSRAFESLIFPPVV